MDKEKKRIDQDDIAVCMVVGGVIGLILSLVIAGLTGARGGNILRVIISSLLVVSILSIIIGFIMTLAGKSSDKAAHIANIKAFQDEYDKYVEELGIVKSDMIHR